MTKDLEKKNAEKEAKINKFKSYLSAMEVDDGKKSLWLEIYENSVEDRENSYVLFYDLKMQVVGNIAHHAVYGPVLAKYLERISKANDQLTKLVEMIESEMSKEVDADEIFEKIGGKK
jgi:hypothetical protein